MFYINDHFYTSQDVKNTIQQWEHDQAISHWLDKRIAIRCSDIFSWLSIVLYAKNKNIQLMPINGDLPDTAAFEKAKDADCHIYICTHSKIQKQIKPANSDKNISNEVKRLHGGLIQFSSGTTGEPKAIFRSWNEIATEIKAYNKIIDLNNDEDIVVACPVTHSYGLICGFLSSLERNNNIHICTGINARYLANICQKYQKPFVYSSPQLLQSLLNVLPSSDNKNSTKLYGAMTSGSLLPESYFNDLKTSCLKFYQQYGCSETGCVSISKNPKNANEIGETLEHCRIESGTQESPSEIIVSQTHSNRIHTQDLGYFDNHQQLHFSSRQDDTIIISGLNVYPIDIENVLLKHDFIGDVVAFKAPINNKPSLLALYSGPSELKPADLRRFCHGYLARYQWPNLFIHTNSIPRLPNGKINRRKLADQYGTGSEESSFETTSSVNTSLEVPA